MLVILFRSRLTEEAEVGEDYQDMAAEMFAYAKTQPGYVDFKQYQAEDGERLSIVKWSDRETLEAWRRNARHREAKKSGREHWYASYDIEIAEVIDKSAFTRKTSESSA